MANSADIKWPPFPSAAEILHQPATEDDIAAGRAAFVIRDGTGQLVGSAVRMGMPRLGFHKQGRTRRVGVAVQVEVANGQCVVGVKHVDGTFTMCSQPEFESASRFLVFHRQSGFGIDEAEQALATGRGKRLKRARRGEVLAVRWKKGPVLFIRHARGDLVAQEVALLRNVGNHAEELAKCDALFEVSFLDLEAVLDESISLLDVQWTLADALPRGFEYLEWNRTLTAITAESH